MGLNTYDVLKDKYFNMKIHVLIANGDYPAVCKLKNHAGHYAVYGCHICMIKGIHAEDETKNYFPYSLTSDEEQG